MDIVPFLSKGEQASLSATAHYSGMSELEIVVQALALWLDLFGGDRQLTLVRLQSHANMTGRPLSAVVEAAINDHLLNVRLQQCVETEAEFIS